MKKENIWLLLVTKIPLDPAAQKEILETFTESFEGGRMNELLTLIRASYMSQRDIIQRKQFYLSLCDLLASMVKRKPSLSAGPHGLYIGFIAEDLLACHDEALQKAGQTLSTAQRIATNPPPMLLPVADPPDLPDCPMAPEAAHSDPEGLIQLLLRQVELFKEAPLSGLRKNLETAREKSPESLRERSNALLLLGGHLENEVNRKWAIACYQAAAAIDGGFDLPWAFLAHHSNTPAEGLEFANKALCANPKSLPGLTNRGTILARQKRFAEALRDFAEVARFDPTNPKAILMCAHAAQDSQDPLRAANLFLHAARAFPVLPEPWFGLARLFWKLRAPKVAKLFQEKFRSLRHGNVPTDLRLSGRLLILGPSECSPILFDDKLSGESPWEIDEVSPGEHRISWGKEMTRKIMVDSGESIKVEFTPNSQEVKTEKYFPAPFPIPVVNPDGSAGSKPVTELLAGFMVKQVEELPKESSLMAILTGIPGPVSPFPAEARLTVEWVFRILLEEILADGVFDREENEILRGVRDRLLIDRPLFDRIMTEARERFTSHPSRSAGPLDPLSLFRRLYEKAAEDGVLEPTERNLLATVSEALLLEPADVLAVTNEFESRLASSPKKS